MKTLFLGYGHPDTELYTAASMLSTKLDWKNKESFSVAFDLFDNGEVDRAEVEATLKELIHIDSLRWYTTAATKLMFAHVSQIQPTIQIDWKKLRVSALDKLTSLNYIIQNPLIQEHDYTVTYHALPDNIYGVWPMDLHRSTGAIITHNDRWNMPCDPKPESIAVLYEDGDINENYPWMFNKELHRYMIQKGHWDPAEPIEPIDEDNVAQLGNEYYFDTADDRGNLPTITEDPESPPLMEVVRNVWRNYSRDYGFVWELLTATNYDITTTDLRSLSPKVADI